MITVTLSHPWSPSCLPVSILRFTEGREGLFHDLSQFSYPRRHRHRKLLYSAPWNTLDSKTREAPAPLGKMMAFYRKADKVRVVMSPSQHPGQILSFLCLFTLSHFSSIRKLTEKDETINCQNDKTAKWFKTWKEMIIVPWVFGFSYELWRHSGLLLHQRDFLFFFFLPFFFFKLFSMLFGKPPRKNHEVVFSSLKVIYKKNLQLKRSGKMSCSPPGPCFYFPQNLDLPEGSSY